MSGAVPRLTPQLIERIQYHDLPFVVLTDCLSSWISALVVWHSNLREHVKHDYSHAMMWTVPGHFASQGVTYESIPMDRYLGGKHRVKLWHRPDWDCVAKSHIRASVRQALNEPWQRRRYDVLGILGQWLYSLTGVGRGVNRGNRYYCSERVRSHLVDEAIPLAHPSPADLDKYFEGSPDWQCYGVYDPELEAKRESA